MVTVEVKLRVTTPPKITAAILTNGISGLGFMSCLPISILIPFLTQFLKQLIRTATHKSRSTENRHCLWEIDNNCQYKTTAFQAGVFFFFFTFL